VRKSLRSPSGLIVQATTFSAFHPTELRIFEEGEVRLGDSIEPLSIRV